MNDINAVRDLNIRLNGLTKADREYVFYYDETNNIRRLHITSEGLNFPKPGCFVLGGVVHEGSKRPLDIIGLRSLLRIQRSAPEIKLKHLGRGGFLEIMDAPKITNFLDWLRNENLWLHYQVLDVVYWSTVDIIDSIVAVLDEPQLIMSASSFKNDLYAVLRQDQVSAVALLNTYSYPDIAETRRVPFLRDLFAMLNVHQGLLHPFNYQMLKGVLDMAKNAASLPFLENEEPNILIDRFGIFYSSRICLFKNAAHFLDVEPFVQDELTAQTFTDGDSELQNYFFVDSIEETGVQLADIVVGILGKMFTFFNNTSVENLNIARQSLTLTQSENASKLKALIDRSVEENRAFAHHIISRDDHCRAAAFFGN